MATDLTAPEKVQAAYRQLSTSAASLNAVSDELRESISELETALEKLNLGVSAWVKIAGGNDDSGQYYWSRDLGYTQFGKEWGLALRKVSGDECHPEDESQQIWQFNEAPRWMRVDGVGKIPELLEALNKQAEDTAKKIKTKTVEAKALAEAIKQLSAQPKDTPRK
jgi:chaperonin cofactor prefoldin